MQVPERCCLVVGLVFGVRLLLGPIPPGFCDCPKRDAPEVVDGDEDPELLVFADVVGLVSSLPPSGLFRRPLGLATPSPTHMHKRVVLILL